MTEAQSDLIDAYEKYEQFAEEYISLLVKLLRTQEVYYTTKINIIDKRAELEDLDA